MFEVYRIGSYISEHGSTLNAGFYVDNKCDKRHIGRDLFPSQEIQPLIDRVDETVFLLLPEWRPNQALLEETVSPCANFNRTKGAVLFPVAEI